MNCRSFPGPGLPETSSGRLDDDDGETAEVHGGRHLSRHTHDTHERKFCRNREVFLRLSMMAYKQARHGPAARSQRG